MIAHRAYRDIQRCEEKYGEAWQEYKRRVPWLFIPVRNRILFVMLGILFGESRRHELYKKNNANIQCDIVRLLNVEYGLDNLGCDRCTTDHRPLL